jgi:hypothetical protein
MYDAVITFVTKDTDAVGNNPMTITKVFRVEFESEEAFIEWLKSSHAYTNMDECPTQLVVSDSGSYDL